MRRRRRLLKISSLVTYSCLASQSQFLYSLSINQILNLNWAIWAMWAAQGSKEKNYTLEGGFHWQNLFLSYLDILVSALKVGWNWILYVHIMQLDHIRFAKSPLYFWPIICFSVFPVPNFEFSVSDLWFSVL